MKLNNGNRICYLSIMLLLAVFLSPQCIFAKIDSPINEVKSTVEKILAIMRDEAMSAEDKKVERRQRILAEVEARFDFGEMSMRTLAKDWKNLSKQEQETFQHLFTQLLENTYTSRIEGYSNEEVVYKKEVVKDDKALVYTAIVKNNKEIPINYKMKVENDQWLVYDVIIEGVSLVRNYRTQFDQILSKEKYDGLIKRMEEKVRKNDEARTGNE